LVDGGEVAELNVFVENLVPDKVDINFDVLGASMRDRIGGNGRAPELSHQIVGGDGKGSSNSLKSMRSQ
jgi:hypothetical protein